MSVFTDVVIIGAGASGLFCAAQAGMRRRSVIVLDHSARIGNKIRISGGGHCNFTNRNVSHENYYTSHNPHFCKSALARFTPHDFTIMMKNHEIRYIEKDDGQLFCSGSSRDIVHMLSSECSRHGVEILLNCRITDLSIKEGKFIVRTNKNVFIADSLVVATGGLSYSQLGASDLGYKIARQFKLKVTPLRPALVPFIFTKTDVRFFSKLRGVSVKSEVECKDRRFKGMMLFTHRGLSGPVILQLSSYWEVGNNITVNLLPDYDINAIFVRERGRSVEMKNLLSGFMPSRLADIWCEQNIRSRPLNQYPEKELGEIAVMLKNWTIVPAGTEGYENAEVTGGGVDTDELSSKTMESKKVPGLYFTGEVIDVTGQLGGYNLHWAWASGYAAGQYV
ncbi:MAG: NAD(P)/FAD-dependent oxidoreductase [Nitrospirae bacterium]|nr:NAD(P)/FAD-dependent oxidoreductase [Nitrospirota bacterium]